VLPQPVAIRLLSALRVVRYPSGPDVLRFIEDNPELPLRATSTSIDPNVLGGALIFATTITVAQCLGRRPVLPRPWLILGAALMGACLILTFSRGSFVGLAVALGLLGLLRHRRLLWIGLLALGVMLLLPPTRVYIEHFIAGVRGEDLATQMRFGEYKDALILISRHPWLGVGFAGTPEVDTYLGVSNVYLLIAEEMGIIGVALFVATLGTLLGSF
ncbi:MAG: O-antigen ligase family protein, partial [Chloroflexi bacterium]|nr:O-antigen ligase family protein [Chloroflexota bacterium]